MQDRPTAAELLGAIRAFLENDVAPELSGRKAFHMRVTLNSLKILDRELAGEEEAVRAEHRRVASLMGRETEPPATLESTKEAVRALNEELARAIRSGEMDGRWAETLDVVRQNVLEKLRIANPSYEGASS